MSLRIEDVHVSYGSGPGSRRVLAGLSASFERGVVTVIVGPNGSGKSTLVRTALGLLTPRQGRVELDGVNVASIRGHDRARRLVYVPQRSDVSFAYSVRELVAMGRYAAGEGSKGDGGDSISRALMQVELADRATDRVGELSAGQQQRVTLARALVQMEVALGSGHGGGEHPTVALMADEPISAMDPRHAINALGIFRSLAEAGVAVCVILHDLTLAARIADRALVLGDGGVVAAHGPAEDVLTPSVLGPVMGLDLARVAIPGGGVLIGPGKGDARPDEAS